MPADSGTLDTVRSVTQSGYKWGFETDIEMDVAPKGLSTDTIRMISEHKQEPSWMLPTLPYRPSRSPMTYLPRFPFGRASSLCDVLQRTLISLIRKAHITPILPSVWIVRSLMSFSISLQQRACLSNQIVSRRGGISQAGASITTAP